MSETGSSSRSGPTRPTARESDFLSRLVVPTVSEGELEASIPRGYYSEPWVAIEGSSIVYEGSDKSVGHSPYEGYVK